MKKVVLIVAYYGKWPKWFDVYLYSCKANPTIDWLFFSDIEVPYSYPSNVRFINTTKTDIELIFKNKFNVNVNLNDPIKLCDLKITYGYIFQEYITNYDFWGICDLDIIWGDIRKFITDDMLSRYEIISSRKDCISGHFTLFANSNKINSLFKVFLNDTYKEKFIHLKYHWFDENIFTEIIKAEISANRINVFWDKYLVNTEKGLYLDSHQDYHIDKWLFENGNLYDLGKSRKEKIECMYLHFINWKRTLKTINFNPGIDQSFYISYNGINKYKHASYIIWLADIKNIFWGYYVKENYRRKREKFKKSLLKIKERLDL